MTTQWFLYGVKVMLYKIIKVNEIDKNLWFPRILECHTVVL